ncbi:hypothetical protein HYZ64_00310 [Candidatus Berkelbacteria bacterium]|nr:hypothetical protein [Candidatus Berkelbacteria bacterium]
MRDQVVGYIIAGLGLVAGLAWNEAIKQLIEDIFPLGQGSLAAKLLYAVVVTLIVVLATILLIRSKDE